MTARSPNFDIFTTTSPQHNEQTVVMIGFSCDTPISAGHISPNPSWWGWRWPRRLVGDHKLSCHSSEFRLPYPVPSNVQFALHPRKPMFAFTRECNILCSVTCCVLKHCLPSIRPNSRIQSSYREDYYRWSLHTFLLPHHLA